MLVYIPYIQNRITASKFKLVTSRIKNFATLAESLLKRSTIKTPAMEYGTLYESEEAEMYAETYNFELFPVGFVINPSKSYLGCSPDRRVFDSSLGEMGLLEVKCTTKEAVSDVGYLSSW